jgi:membrane protease YdiL (CAAX protease family)
MSVGLALAVTLTTLVVVDVWVHLGPPRVHMLTGPLAALALLLVGRAAGLTWAQLGLARADLLPGLVYGGVAAAAIAVVYVVAVALPFTRGAFRDTRYEIGARAAAFVAIVSIPLSTVIFEEVAFRGVLWGLLEADHGVLVATSVSSALFGVWHILPAMKLARTNTAVRGDRDVSGSRAILTVLGTVLFTTVAGVLFAELRRRSGSLVAPMVLHWATNGLGVLAAARVWAMTARRAP